MNSLEKRDFDGQMYKGGGLTTLYIQYLNLPRERTLILQKQRVEPYHKIKPREYYTDSWTLVKSIEIPLFQGIQHDSTHEVVVNN